MLKTYTVTTNGDSDGNVIVQPFTIEILNMQYSSEGPEDKLIVTTCTRNGSGNVCENSDIPHYNEFALPGMTSSKNTDLSNSIEGLLDTAYGNGNWS